MRNVMRRALSTAVAWRPSTAASAGSTSLASATSGTYVTLQWADGLKRHFHPLWLLDNCSSRRHPGTRQKLQTPADLPAELRVESVDFDADVLTIQWQPNAATAASSSSTSSFCANWLRSFGSVHTASRAEEGEPRAGVVMEEASKQSTRPLLPTQQSLPRFAFADLVDGDEASKWEWLSALAETGATLLEGVPERVAAKSSPDMLPMLGDEVGVDGVRFIAELIGPMQPNIYGDIFDVVSKGDGAINLAYTSERIGPHMDLCYYESPPGLQLLHCLRFDEDVKGGESLLVDAFAVAEAVRARSPAAFEILSTIPATFLKDHSRRERPVLLSYQRPHLSVEPRSKRVVGAFWSPPFEGPLQSGVHLSSEAVGEYYSAYQLLEDEIRRAPTWEARLKVGEMLVFNNRRMLHGRSEFSGGARDGARHMRGGYVNIDEYANAYNLLRRTYGEQQVPASHLANQDWATGPIELPKEA